jgi:hypothetical protein
MALGSCRTTERNGNIISADVTDGANKTIRTDPCISYLQTICQLFGLFDIAGYIQYTYIFAK